MSLKTISLLMGFLVFLFGQADGGEPVDARPLVAEKTQISERIAARFADALQKRNYPFMTENKVASLGTEIADFTARYQPAQMSGAEQESLLAAIDRYVPENFLNRHLDSPDDFSSDWDVEGAYLKFRDSVNTFKWKLWLALTRRPLTAEQFKQRQIQHNWLREFIAGVPLRPADWGRKGVVPTGVRKWALTYLEEQLANPLSLLCEPMTENQFEVFKEWMKRSAANGLSYTVTNIPVRALGARAHNHGDVEKAYAYPFDIELPFEDEVRSIWGGGDGAGPHLAFASNAQFRGQDVFLDARSEPIFDILKGVCRIAPQEQVSDPAESIARWTRKYNGGHIAYDDAKATLVALRGAKIAELRVADWFEADRVSNSELRKLTDEKGQMDISVKRLPPMNGPRQVGVNEPRFFIVVQSRDDRLAVMDLRTREFGLNLVSRLRSADSTTD